MKYQEISTFCLLVHNPCRFKTPFCNNKKNLKGLSFAGYYQINDTTNNINTIYYVNFGCVDLSEDKWHCNLPTEVVPLRTFFERLKYFSATNLRKLAHVMYRSISKIIMMQIHHKCK